MNYSDYYKEEVLGKWFEEKQRILGDAYNPNTLKILALQEEFIDFIAFFLEQGQKNGFEDNRNSLLFMAAMFGKLNMVKWLVNVGADINSITEFGDNGGTPIFAAIANENKEDFEVVSWLKENGAKIINIKNIYGYTLISSAALSEKIEMIKFLVKLGADINEKNENNTTPLYMAALAGKTESIKCLVSLGAKIDEKVNNMAPIFIAASKGQVESIKCLVSLGVNVNVTDDNGMTPVFMAASGGHVDCIECLKSLGADINIKTNEGFTPFFMAVAACKIESMKCLKSLGADINVKHNGGKTPLTFAKEVNELAEAAKWLEANGAQE